MHVRGRTFDEVKVGDAFVEHMTISDAHLALGAALIGDFNPLHVEESFAARSRHGGRILHGVITSAIIGAPAGMVFAGTAIGYLEHNCRFLAPVRAGDRLTTTWTVTATEAKVKHGGGVVRMQADCLNQAGIAVAQATGVMLVGNAPVARAS
jgi:3-hydroxybutyryl-CoA dehydratase